MEFNIDKCVIGMIPINNLKAFDQFLPDEFVGNEESTILLGAAANGFAVGLLWAEMRTEGCELMQFAVHPAFRRNGIGSKLMDSFLSVIVKMEQPVSVYGFFTDDENRRTLRNFLDASGHFVLFDKGKVISIASQDLRNATGYNKLKKRDDGSKNPIPFFSMSNRDIQKIINDMSSKDYLFPQDLITNKDKYEEKLCLCMMDNNKIDNAIFARKNGKTIQIVYMYGNDNLSGMRQLLCAVIKEFDKDYKDFDVEAETDLPSVQRIIDYISDGKTNEYSVIHAMWDMIENK